jgi:hypothetical protein
MAKRRAAPSRPGHLYLKRPKYQRDATVGPYTLRNYLDGGGNGEVWEVIDDGGTAVAIKLCRTADPMLSPIAGSGTR